MKARTQILLSFLILGLIIISSSILGVFRIKHQLEEIGHFHTDALYSIQSLNSKLTEAVEESFAYVVSGEMAEKVEFMHWADNFQQEAQKFSNLAGLDRPGKKKERALYNKILSHHPILVEQAKGLFAEFETTGAISRKTFISYEETIDILTDVMSEFVNLEKTEVEHSQQFALKTIEQAEYWVFGLGGFTLMIAMGLGLYLAGRISKPLEQLNKAAAEIGKGEYGSPVEVESINEIGTLANTFNTMAGQIKERTESLVKSNEERQQLVYELKQANRELEERNVEMEQFTFRVSHDLRAPLVNIKGFAGELQESLDSLDSTLNDALPGLEKKLRNTVNPIINKDIPESLDFINSSVTRMDQLINAILKLARLEKRVMDFQPLEMNELVQSTLKTLAHQIEKRKIKVTVSNLPQVMADRTSMDQIMGNLLSNAINYLDGKRPGVIEISADCKDL